MNTIRRLLSVLLVVALTALPAHAATNTKVSNVAAIAACNAIVDLLDAGSPPGLLKIYTTGSGIPADCDVALTDQTLLATLTLANPAFGNCADNTGKATATAGTITADSSADATGTATFFRAVNAAGTCVIQGTVGTATSDLIMNSVSFSSGAAISVSSWTFSVPE